MKNRLVWATAARERQDVNWRAVWGLAAVLTAVLLWGGSVFVRMQGWQVILLERDHWGFGSIASPVAVFDEDFSPDAGCFRLGMIDVRRMVYYQWRRDRPARR